MEPIIFIKYYTEDSEMRAMIDMYWALNQRGTHRYKNNDFVKNFGINTHRLHYHIKGYYEAYCIYDKCCECATVSRFLKKRQDRYKKNTVTGSVMIALSKILTFEKNFLPITGQMSIWRRHS